MGATLAAVAKEPCARRVLQVAALAPARVCTRLAAHAQQPPSEPEAFRPLKLHFGPVQIRRASSHHEETRANGTICRHNTRIASESKSSM